ncbi:MAG TPA: hypothetical protein PKV72_05300 [Candidatus Peribacteria bacterium]|nr:hypothetical protein [Candidatus Peribacteria bacterium]
MTRLFFITHTPGKTHRATRVFPPPHRMHAEPQAGMQFPADKTVSDPAVSETPASADLRGTGTPDCSVPSPQQAAEAPSQDDWLYDVETQI